MLFSRFSLIIFAFVSLFLISFFILNAFFVQQNVVLWTLILFCAMVAVFFTQSTQRTLLFFLFSYVLAFMGVLSFWHMLFAVCIGFIFADVFFRFFLKYHTPTADTISIALSFFGALASIYGGSVIAKLYGLVSYQVSVRFLLVSAGLACIFSILLFFLLIIISNYSKYGSLMKNLA